MTSPPLERAGPVEPVEPVESLEKAARPARRPYRAPKVRHLGCVRDLTLGASSGVAEGAGTFIRPM